MKKKYSLLFCVLFFIALGCKTAQGDDFHANNVKFISFIMEQSIDQEKNLTYSQYRCEVYKLILDSINLAKNINDAQFIQDIEKLNIKFYGGAHYGYQANSLLQLAYLTKNDDQQKIWLKCHYDFLVSYLQAKNQKDKDKAIDMHADVMVKFYQIDERNGFLLGTNYYQHNAHAHNKKYLETVCQMHDKNKAFNNYIGAIDKLILNYANNSQQLDDNVLREKLAEIKVKHASVYNQDSYALDLARVKGLIQLARRDSQTKKYLQSTLDFFTKLDATLKSKKRDALINSFADEFILSLSMNIRNDNVVVLNNRAMNKMVECIIALDNRRQFDTDIYKHASDQLIHKDVMKNQDEEEKSYKKDVSKFLLEMNNIHDNAEKLKKIEEFAPRYAEGKKSYTKLRLAPIKTQDGKILAKYFEL